MTWQWQPLLPGAAQLQAGGATTYAIQLSPASFAYTPSSLSVSTKRVVTLSPASFAYTANDLTVAIQQATTYSIELLPASFSYTPSALEVSATGQGGSLPTGSGHKRKTLPYGWWNTESEAKADIAEAEKVIAEAKAEVKHLGEVRETTLAELNAALWFADVERKLTSLETASKQRAQNALQAIAAEVARLKREALAAELDEEEAITLLFSGL